MKKKILFGILLSISFIVLSNTVYSQECLGFHHHGTCWTKDIKKDYKQYGQARSAMIEANKTFSYQAMFYGKKDYKVLVCTENGFYPIHFVIYEADTKKVIYDNAEDNYLEYVGFIMEKNTNLLIEMSVMTENEDPRDGSELRVCAGIQIIWKKIPQMGFRK